jgi:hypothetical protein
MKKILLAIDAINLNINSLDFACFLARLTKSKITGVFLENRVSEEKPELKAIQGAAYIDWTVDENSDEHKAKMESIKKNIVFLGKVVSTGKLITKYIMTVEFPQVNLLKKAALPMQ